MADRTSQDPTQRSEDAAAPYRPFVRAGVVLLLLLLVTAGIKSWRDLSDARALEQSLETEISATEERIRILEGRLARIEKDPATLEQLAREELGWVREGDLVVVLPDGDAEPQAEPAAGPASLPPGG